MGEPDMRPVRRHERREDRRPEVRRKMRHVPAQAGCLELHGRGRPVRRHSCSAQACYQKEASECKKVEVVPAKVLDLFQHMQHQNKVSSMLKHIVIEMGQKICISKQQREVELFCLPKDREGMTMRQMAESGDKIERASSYPTESVAIVYEPEMC